MGSVISLVDFGLYTNSDKMYENMESRFAAIGTSRSSRRYLLDSAGLPEEFRLRHTL